MKIAIAPFGSTFINFFLNLTNSLEALGHSVTFINPDAYTAYILKKLAYNHEFYKNTENTYNIYNEESNIVRHYMRLYKIGNVKKVISIKNYEFTQAKEFLSKHKFDKIIIWNGDDNVESEVCKLLKIKCLFCENGYFPNTFQMNQFGVNSNAEFADLNYEEFMNFRFKSAMLNLPKINIIKLKQSVAKRFILRFTDKRYRRIMLSAIIGNINKNKAKKAFNNALVDNVDFDKIGKFIFFPLQVNSDTQIILNSTYDSMYHALEHNIPKLLKLGYKIILKEHPAEIEKVDYSKFADSKNVFLIKKFDIDKLINKAEFVTTINSSVGLQAIAAHKPVVILGESFYSSAPNVSVSKQSDEIIVKQKFNNTKVDEYIKHFADKIFITGNWQKPDLIFLNKICNRILA